MNSLVIVFLAIVIANVSSETATSEEPISILSQQSEVNPDGSYFNKWESANGISVEEQGSLKLLEEDKLAQVVKGSASWTAPDGTEIHLSWTADENGFQPVGEHLPTPHPIPDYILKSLEWAAAHPYDEKAELAKRIDV